MVLITRTGVCCNLYCAFIAAFDFLKRHPLDPNISEFENNCGVGVIVTTKDIEDEVNKFITGAYTSLLYSVRSQKLSMHTRLKYLRRDTSTILAPSLVSIEKVTDTSSHLILGNVRASLKWADGKILKSEVDKQV